MRQTFFVRTRPLGREEGEEAARISEDAFFSPRHLASPGARAEGVKRASRSAVRCSIRGAPRRRERLSRARVSSRGTPRSFLFFSFFFLPARSRNTSPARSRTIRMRDKGSRARKALIQKLFSEVSAQLRFTIDEKISGREEGEGGKSGVARRDTIRRRSSRSSRPSRGDSGNDDGQRRSRRSSARSNRRGRSDTRDIWRVSVRCATP